MKLDLAEVSEEEVWEEDGSQDARRKDKYSGGRTREDVVPTYTMPEDRMSDRRTDLRHRGLHQHRTGRTGRPGRDRDRDNRDRDGRVKDTGMYTLDINISKMKAEKLGYSGAAMHSHHSTSSTMLTTTSPALSSSPPSTSSSGPSRASSSSSTPHSSSGHTSSAASHSSSGHSSSSTSSESSVNSRRLPPTVTRGSTRQRSCSFSQGRRPEGKLLSNFSFRVRSSSVSGFGSAPTTPTTGLGPEEFWNQYRRQSSSSIISRIVRRAIQRHSSTVGAIGCSPRYNMSSPLQPLKQTS